METIKRVLVFSTPQRITHWLLAAGMSFELISAWLIQHSDVDPVVWMDWHSMIGQVLLLVLGFRLLLLFTNGSGYWRLFIPTREQRHTLAQTLRFYLSLGRLPCPDWYAYNPVWQPIYLLMLLLMLLSTLSGLLTGSYFFLFGISVSGWHGIIAYALGYLVLAHILFAVWHDVKGNGAQISAMLNGYKYFIIKPSQSTPEQPSVSIDSLLKK
jgi:Ni/Fe-hydrogenase 1 B-type cytochrome subunit